MSTRHLLNIGMGTVALLLAASVGVVFTSLGDKGNDNIRIDLATSQQGLVQNLSQQVKTLTNAENLMQVSQARKELGATILSFDQNLTALVHGGTVTSADGIETSIIPPNSSLVKTDLDSAAKLWVQTGIPLADLAAGEFSIFSSAGQSAAVGLNDNGAELMEQLGNAATNIRSEAQAQFALGTLARWFTLGLTFVFIGLGVARFKPSREAQSPKPKTNSTITQTPMHPVAPEDQAPDTGPATAQVWNSQPHKPFTSPVDFDNVSASVDQLSVDMNTIAGSTNKMQVAIDSVGHAMHGMLFSLNQMAQDTAEGYKIVRGANNAASYTKNTAGELAESALEMSRVVARVTQLAMKTKQIAGQIEAEAVHTGSTGEAFTSVVATEVKGLAQQTSQATAGIEQTVAEILGTARQYEEAIGQIIKNISAINKVSENLGELMLHPPSAGVAGTPLPAAAPMQLAPQPVAAPAVAAPAAAPAPAPVVEPVAVATPAPAPEAVPEPEPVAEVPAAPAEPAPAAEPVDSWGAPENDLISQDPTADEVAEKTSEAIKETATEPESSGSSGNVFMLGGGPKKAKPKAVEPVVEESATEEPKAVEPEPAAAKEEKEDDGGNIFMLNKPKKEPEAKAPTEEPKAEEPAPEPVPTPAPAPAPVEEKKDDGDSNIFMLNKPKSAPAEPAAEVAPEPQAEEPAVAVEVEEEEEDEGPNVYNLKRPQKSASPKTDPVAKEEPVTVPADETAEEKDEGGGNIFMLNKPKS